MELQPDKRFKYGDLVLFMPPSGKMIAKAYYAEAR